MTHIGVIGAGAWGCALAMQAVRAGNRVTLWARRPDQLALRPTGRMLPATVGVTGDLDKLSADLLLLAVPVQHMRPIIPSLPATPVVACSKGMEAGSLLLPLEVLAALRPGLRLAVLSGPNFAHEVAAGQPGAAVLASADPALREMAIEMLSGAGFRLYGSADPIGVQVGGAGKNVIAIAAGAVMGAGLGENARAALVTRGLAELGRLAAALGGQAETMAGLSGLGDLLLTCTGASSRNFALGFRLGQGEALGDISLAGPVIEGMATAPALVARGAGLDLPICASVAAVIEGSLVLVDAVRGLLSRPRRQE